MGFSCLDTQRIMSDEKRLIKHLLGNYQEVGVVGRPVLNQSETIKVSYGLSLIQILEMDEKNQVLTTNVWSRYVSSAIVGVLRQTIHVLELTSFGVGVPYPHTSRMSQNETKNTC